MNEKEFASAMNELHKVIEVWQCRRIDPTVMVAAFATGLGAMLWEARAGVDPSLRNLSDEGRAQKISRLVASISQTCDDFVGVET